MKAKLHKMVSGYILSLNGDIDDPYAIVNEELAKDHEWYRLSLRNCQAIERGYDLDELAYEYDLDTIENVYGQVKAFKAGFQKSLELMGDKKFSEDFLKRMCSISFNFYKRNDLSDCELEKEWENWLKNSIQPLQQTEWDVEFEMEYVGECNGNNDEGCFQDSPGHNCGCFGRRPKLDATGCLILKRI